MLLLTQDSTYTHPEASVSKVNGSEKSGKTKTSALVIACLSKEKASFALLPIKVYPS